MPALLVVLFLLATSVSSVSTGVRTIVVHGTVSSELGAPIHGANVFVAGSNPAQSVLTDASGTFRLSITVSDSATTFDIRARALGYQPAFRRPTTLPTPSS